MPSQPTRCIRTARPDAPDRGRVGRRVAAASRPASCRAEGIARLERDSWRKRSSAASCQMSVPAVGRGASSSVLDEIELTQSGFIPAQLAGLCPNAGTRSRSRTPAIAAGRAGTGLTSRSRVVVAEAAT
jgi:hypothetical protein